MGRKKIAIKAIDDDRARQVTFPEIDINLAKLGIVGHFLQT